jgi:Mg/Co/Ni transporter MgtE
VRRAGWDVCIVVNHAGVVQGLLRAAQLAIEGNPRVEEVMRPGPSTFRPNVDVEEIAQHMSEHQMDNTLITTPDGVLVGVLFREDAERAAREASVDG